MSPDLTRATAAFDRQAWSDALDAFTAAGREGPLSAADHERAAVCAYLVGADDRCARAWEAAHRAALQADDPAGAARCAFWLALCLMLRGQPAQAGGWLGRAEGELARAGEDCAAAGYLLIPRLLHALDGGDPGAARELAVRAREVGDRFDDADLRAFGTLGHGQALIALGDPAAGTARLDEAMIAVTDGEVGPIATGIVYCAVIFECMNLFDIARAAEWTDALSAWCDAQPDLVPYRGQCLVHRAQLQQAAGRWPVAAAAATEACRRLTDPPHPALGMAYYQLGELHRLTGALGDAEGAYRQAARNGYHPMPGLALLHLTRGDAATAAAAIHRALQETPEPGGRPRILAAAVEILLAVDELPAARAAADELAMLAAVSSASMLAALSAHANGAVLVAEGEAVAGLAELRAAAAIWHGLRMPYEAARAAVLLGQACAALGDERSAALEFDNARDAFVALGATSELEQLAAIAATSTGSPSDGNAVDASLSSRELEVLALVAAGRTNRQIAAELTISQHTVGRHLENIFGKLDVSTRAMAIAHAYENHLL